MAGELMVESGMTELQDDGTTKLKAEILKC
jgi:hypothetical protein